MLRLGAFQMVAAGPPPLGKERIEDLSQPAEHAVPQGGTHRLSTRVPQSRIARIFKPRRRLGQWGFHLGGGVIDIPRRPYVAERLLPLWPPHFPPYTLPCF